MSISMAIWTGLSMGDLDELSGLESRWPDLDRALDGDLDERSGLGSRWPDLDRDLDGDLDELSGLGSRWPDQDRISRWGSR